MSGDSKGAGDDSNQCAPSGHAPTGATSVRRDSNVWVEFKGEQRRNATGVGRN